MKINKKIDNVYHIEFGSDDDRANARIYRYDTGQLIKFYDIPDGVEVQFSNEHSTNGTINKRITDSMVQIPDSLLTSKDNIIAYIKYIDENSETTTKLIKFGLLDRAKPGDYVSPDEEPSFRSFVEEQLKAAKETVEKNKDYLKETIENTEKSKEYMDTTDSNRRTVEGLTEKNKEYATQTESNAESASTSASNASESASNASQSASNAKGSADNASVSAKEAKDAAVKAGTSESNAKEAESNINSAVTEFEQTKRESLTEIGNLTTNSKKEISDLTDAKKAELNKINDDITQNAGELKEAIATGSTAKNNLDTAISNASKTRSDLNAVITSAQDAQLSLPGVITQATTAQTNLQNATDSASNALNQLTAENVSAKSNLDALRSENFNSQEIMSGVTDIRAYLGMIDIEDVLGLQVDYKNKTCTRIAGAKNLTAGADFDKFKMFGGRKRCNVSDGGTINAYYGDEGYTEDGSNGQVMVYQPKFYYLVCPLEYDRQETGYGYHLRKANYYVSETQRAGFKLHPAFYDKNGNEVDYILMSAYEGCIYDTSVNAYMLNDEQVIDVSTDKFSSVAGTRPALGASQNLTRPNIEQIAKNRGEGWHSLGIKTASMEQLLMIVEMGMMNLQTAIGQGVVNLPWTTSSDTISSYAGATGSTASLGNGTGRATKTTTYEGGKATDYTVDGKTSTCYRGVENFWGNIWKFVYGINIWGNGKMAGGMPYICSDFNYAEGKNTDNYEGAGFTVAQKKGHISAMGYSTKYDWLFIASECLGNSSLPVGDYTWLTQNLNGYRIARLGGNWNSGSNAGGFYWNLDSGVGSRNRDIGSRLVYIPTVTV